MTWRSQKGRISCPICLDIFIEKNSFHLFCFSSRPPRQALLAHGRNGGHCITKRLPYIKYTKMPLFPPPHPSFVCTRVLVTSTALLRPPPACKLTPNVLAFCRPPSPTNQLLCSLSTVMLCLFLVQIENTLAGLCTATRFVLSRSVPGICPVLDGLFWLRRRV